MSAGILNAVTVASGVGKHLGVALVPSETQAAPVFPAALSKFRTKIKIVRLREREMSFCV